MITLSQTLSIRRWAQPLASGLLSATLAACGSGQRQGGLILPGTPTAAAMVAKRLGATGATTPGPAPSIAEQIAALERSGAYPALDRSTDIAGPDANNNGVRDDIEAWINAQPVNDAQRKALMQEARALQGTLTVSLKDQNAVQAADDRLAASSQCGSIQFSPYDAFSKLARRIEAMTANTSERAGRYMQFDAPLSGSSSRLPNGNTCDP
jgi:hypothetical protein